MTEKMICNHSVITRRFIRALILIVLIAGTMYLLSDTGFAAGEGAGS